MRSVGEGEGRDSGLIGERHLPTPRLKRFDLLACDVIEHNIDGGLQQRVAYAKLHGEVYCRVVRLACASMRCKLSITNRSVAFVWLQARAHRHHRPTAVAPGTSLNCQLLVSVVNVGDLMALMLIRLPARSSFTRDV